MASHRAGLHPLQKVLQHGVAVFGEDAFRVELHAFDRQQRGVAHALNFAVLARVAVTARQSGSVALIDHQRVVAVRR